jgi:hypothetical protein
MQKFLVLISLTSVSGTLVNPIFILFCTKRVHRPCPSLYLTLNIIPSLVICIKNIICNVSVSPFLLLQFADPSLFPSHSFSSSRMFSIFLTRFANSRFCLILAGSYWLRNMPDPTIRLDQWLPAGSQFDWPVRSDF